MEDNPNEKLRMMEDEMNRFEAEIASPVPPHLIGRAVIGANTYNQVQRRLEEQQVPDFHPGMFCPPLMNMMPGFGIPPPPPPPPLLIPHQLQHRPMRNPMPMNMMPPAPDFGHNDNMNHNMNHGINQNMNHNMNQNMNQNMGQNMNQNMNQNMGQNMSQNMNMPPQYGPGTNNGPQLPVTTSANVTRNSASLSVAPMLYNPKSSVPKMKPSRLKSAGPSIVSKPAIMDTYATFQNELSQLEESKASPPPKKPKTVDVGQPTIVNKYESLQAKDMALKLKANAIAASLAAGTSTTEEHPTGRKKKKNKLIRMAGGQTWEDGSLAEWEEDDYRIFCGDLGNDVTDEILTRTFNKYPSFLKAKVVRDKRSNKTKGFGFVSFKDPQDFIKAMKEMNGRYVGSRPIKLRKSCWKSRNLDNVRKKEKEKTALIGMLTGR